MDQDTHACIDCGDVIADRPRWSRRCTTCAATAARAAANAAHRRRNPLPARRCQTCLTEITNLHHNAKRCKPCAAAFKTTSRSAPPREHACIDCGCDLSGRYHNAKRCNGCVRAEKVRAATASYANTRPRTQTCGTCGGVFQVKRSDTMYCGRECWRIAHVDQTRDRRRGRGRSHWGGAGVTVRDWKRLVRHYRGCCAYCGRPAATPEMDHLVPLARGGRHTIGNVLPACRRCNGTKNARLLIEWKNGRSWKRGPRRRPLRPPVVT